ncbi:MAG: hypothetical protein ACYDCH_00260 [Gaiellaceae bacterium]
MPTRKQKRREAKTKRHEYEVVYVDDEGNEVDAPPPEEQRDAKRAPAKSGRPQKPQRPARGRRPARVPQPPSWQRAAKRAGVIGGVVFVLFALGARKGGYLSAALLAILYTGMFIPLTFVIDRFAYRRYQARLAAGGAPPARKR